MARLLSEKYEELQHTMLMRFNQLKSDEERLNTFFTQIYGLQGELTTTVENKDVTVHRLIDTPNDEERKMAYVLSIREEIVSLLSYIVGCILGRYSPYKDGPIYTGGKWDYELIHTQIVESATQCEWYEPKEGLFLPEKVGIIPITDDSYFATDIVSQIVDFLCKVYGSKTLEANLKFVADALGGRGTSREVIQNYFLNDFYVDHLKAYQKRPIYWLFSSGKKNGFKCLVYMHRYQPDLLARIRTDYVHEQQERYRTQLTVLEDALQTAAASDRVKLNKQIAKLKDQALELQQYEEKIHHLADQMLDIDLDDGVKVNYGKFAEVLEKIK